MDWTPPAPAARRARRAPRRDRSPGGGSGRGARLPHTDRDGVLRSALAIKALANPLTGAIAAAATTSLPESGQAAHLGLPLLVGTRLGAPRCAPWPRSASRTRPTRSAASSSALRRATPTSCGSPTALAASAGCRGVLDSLRGWRGIGPVRIGNGAGTQRQHDVLGQLLDLAWHWHRRGNAPDDDLWHFLGAGRRAANEWRLPDRGIWEWRGGPRHFTHSKVMCWVALDRGIRLAEDTAAPPRSSAGARSRAALREQIESAAYDPRQGAFTQCFDGPALDAALLRLSAVGFLEPGTSGWWAPSTRSRRARRRRAVRRYGADDGQPGREGAFLPARSGSSSAWRARAASPRRTSASSAPCSARNDLGAVRRGVRRGAGAGARQRPPGAHAPLRTSAPRRRSTSRAVAGPDGPRAAGDDSG